MERVKIQWTETAWDGLSKLPPKVRKGLIAKANELRDADDPTKAHKPLTGPLTNHFRITYSRYCAIYCVEKESLASGDVLQHVSILFVAVGKRKEGDKDDIYRFAEKLVRLGILKVREDPPHAGEELD